MVLTYRDRLPGGVAAFLEDQGVGTVFVAGGPVAVSDAVVAELKGLASKPRVVRVAGADRYATAAAMAGRVRSSARWCGSDDEAVLLANGDRVPFTSAVLAGPLSYRMQVPLLLTAADRLPAVSADYIGDNGIDRVVIVGDVSEVSEGVADAVTALGARVDRYAGGDAAATSVRLAELMWGGCGGLGTDTGRVALVSESSTADGVAAGPVMGRGLDRDGRPVPILVVGAELPGVVRDWLAATPVKDASGNKTHMSVVAVGGTAAVSAGVVSAAVAAAGSAPSLSASISAQPASRSGRVTGDPSVFTVTFSDAIRSTRADLSKLVGMLFVNGVSALVSKVELDDAFPPAGSCTAGTRVTATLLAPLKAGDKVELRPDRDAALGASGDMRRVGAASFTVPLKASVSVVPPLEVIAVEGQKQVYLRTTGAVGGDEDLVLSNGKVSVTSKRGAKVSVAALEDVSFRRTNTQAFDPALTLAEAFDFNGDKDKTDTNEAKGSPYFLAAGDTVTVERGALSLDGVGSRLERAAVAKRTPKPKVASIRVGRPDTGVNDDPADDGKPGGLPGDVAPKPTETGFLSLRPVAHMGAPVGAAFSDPRARIKADDGSTSASITWPASGLTVAREMQAYARWDGIAAGAKGNDWAVRFDYAKAYWAPGAALEDEEVEIDVTVGRNVGRSGGGLVRVTFLAGSPTLGDIADALNADRDFADNFTLAYDCADREKLITARPANESAVNTYWHRRFYPLIGGVSSVGIEVTFGEWHSAHKNTSELRNFLLGSLVPGWNPDNAADLIAAADVYGNSNYVADSAQRKFTHHQTGNVAAARPIKVWHLRFTTGDASLLPGPRTGVSGGAIMFPGYYYDDSGTLVDLWEGEPAKTPFGIRNINWDGRFPVSYLNPTASDQVEDDSQGVPGKLPAQIDDDGDGNAKQSKTAGVLTEQVEWAAPDHTVRVTAGDVPSYQFELPVN